MPVLEFFSEDIVCERRGSREKYKQTNFPITVNILYFRLSIYHYIPQSLQKFLESCKTTYLALGETLQAFLVQESRFG